MNEIICSLVTESDMRKEPEPPVPRSLLCRSAVKQYAAEQSGFENISAKFLDECEAKLKAIIEHLIAAANPDRKTLLASKDTLLNHDAVKAFALKVSQVKRRGKFTRVAPEFIESVSADVESQIRRLAVGVPTSDGEDTIPADIPLVNPSEAIPKVIEKLNEFATRSVRRRIHLTRTGKTLI